jgi:hypothetical protein
MTLPDDRGRSQPVIGAVRRHADIGDDEVRRIGVDRL